MPRPWSRRVRRAAPPVVLTMVVLLVLAVIVSQFTTSPTRPARPVVISTGDWEPFVGPDLLGGGPLATLVSEVLQRQGYAPRFDYTTWPLALQRAEEGRVLATFPFVGSDDRRDQFVVSDPLVAFDYVLFVSRSDDQAMAIETAADLEGVKVAQIAGYDYWDELDAADPDYVPFPSKEAAMEALATGAVRVVPEGLLSGNAVLAASAFSGDAGAITHLEPGDNPLLGSTEGLSLMVRPSDGAEAFMEEFNARLAEVKTSELYSEVLSALSAPSSDQVVLQPHDPTRLVALRDPQTRRSIVVATGTPARVIAWPQAFRRPTAGEPRAARVTLEVLAGPSRGRTLTADARDVVLGGLP